MDFNELNELKTVKLKETEVDDRSNANLDLGEIKVLNFIYKKIRSIP